MSKGKGPKKKHKGSKTHDAQDALTPAETPTEEPITPEEPTAPVEEPETPEESVEEPVEAEEPIEELAEPVETPVEPEEPETLKIHRAHIAKVKNIARDKKIVGAKCVLGIIKEEKAKVKDDRDARSDHTV